MVPSFSTETFKQELLKTVIAADLSFRTVEHPQFRRLVNVLRSNVIVPSASTMRRTVEDHSGNIILEIQKAIPSGIQIHLATDTWTSTNGLAFAGTTMHYIDKNWEIKEHVIGFQPLTGSAHTGLFLAEKLNELITQYDLTSRILCLTTDNVQTNTVMARELPTMAFGSKWNPEQYHLPCLAHVLALCSKAFMENLRSQPSNERFDPNPDLDIAALTKYPSGSFSRSVFKVCARFWGWDTGDVYYLMIGTDFAG